MKAVIIDYGSGNLHSALKAFERAAGGSGQITVTSDPDVVRKAKRKGTQLEQVYHPGVRQTPAVDSRQKV